MLSKKLTPSMELNLRRTTANKRVDLIQDQNWLWQNMLATEEVIKNCSSNTKKKKNSRQSWWILKLNSQGHLGISISIICLKAAKSRKATNCTYQGLKSNGSKLIFNLKYFFSAYNICNSSFLTLPRDFLQLDFCVSRW